MSFFRKRLLDHDVFSYPSSPAFSSSNSPRRTKKRRKSSDPAFDDDDEDYCPPDLPVVDKGREPSIPGPDRTDARGARDARDPFDFFEDAIVHVIITKLDAADTETLRRVCKTWKATSEAHCGRNALRLHFPEAAGSLCDDEQGSVEEENLRFRRYLYHQQCMRLGHATRAIRCTGATTWHLKNHTLLWANTGGNVSIRALRTAGVGISPHAPAYVADEVINLRQFPIDFYYISRVWLLEEGELVVQLVVSADPATVDRDLPEPVGLLRILRVNKTGSVLWEIACRPEWWSKPAIGETGVYFVTEGLVDRTPKLIKFSIQTGLALSDQVSNREERGGFKETNQAPDALVLTSHERFAVWRDVDSVITFFSTSSREIIFLCTTKQNNQILTSIADDGIWSINPKLLSSSLTFDLLLAHGTAGEVENFFMEGSYFASCKGSSTDFILKPIQFPWTLRQEGSKWAFDGDSGAFFMTAYTLLSEVMRWEDPHPVRPPFGLLFGARAPIRQADVYIDPFAKVMIATAHRPPPSIPEHIHFEYEEDPVEVSLPPSRQQPGQRRPLEVEIQFEWGEGWKTKEGDYFRMVENYLIHHSPEGNLLHLIDFWPTW